MYKIVNLKKLFLVLYFNHWRVGCEELKILNAKSVGKSSVPVNIRNVRNAQLDVIKGLSEIKGLLFDKDGTLFDFDKTWNNWTSRILSEISSKEVNGFQKD